MRWLLLKDLRILGRSPLLVALLVLYPILIAVLVGFALSRGPEKPRVAFLTLVPPAERVLDIGGSEVNTADYSKQIFSAIDPVPVKTKAQAIEAVRSGAALAALIIPEDTTRKLQAQISSGGDRPAIEVYYNAEDPVKAEYVESTIKARLADANAAIARQFNEVAARYIELLLQGGSFSVLGQQIEILGLQRASTILSAVQRSLPPRDPRRVALQQVIDFSNQAIRNLDVPDDLVSSVQAPLAVKRTVVNGSKVPLESFAVAVAVALSLMLVTVLLAAGMLALEREEHTFRRLVRGLVSRTGLVTEKIGLAALCGFAVTLLMLFGLALFVDLDWGRLPLWIAALALGASAFAALGVAIGGLAQEVRAASLLAILLSLPIAFLALVPSGAVSGGLFDAIRVVSALFPFKPALQALNAALNGADPALPIPLLHLAALTLGFGVIGRFALRRMG